MDRLTFDIFIPDKKRFRLTPNWIMIIFGFVPILILAIIEGNIGGRPNAFEAMYFTCIFLLIIYYLITSFFKYQPLNGKMEGKVEFKDDRIIVNAEEFELKRFTSLDFSFSDYYGKPSTNGRDFNPKISQGVGNNISFTYDNGNEHLIWFRFQGEHSYLSISPFINEAVKAGKIHIYRAEDLIGKENILK